MGMGYNPVQPNEEMSVHKEYIPITLFSALDLHCCVCVRLCIYRGHHGIRNKISQEKSAERKISCDDEDTNLIKLRRTISHTFF